MYVYILPSLARITCALPSSFARANRPRGRLESIHQSSSPHSINSRNDQSERSSSPAASTARRAALRPAHTRAHEPWLRYDYFASFDSLARSRARPSRRRPRRAGVGGRPRSRRRVARVRIARIRGRFVAHRARGWGRARARVMHGMRARCASREAGDDERRARGEDALGWVRARWGWVKSQARLLGRRPS